MTQKGKEDGEMTYTKEYFDTLKARNNTLVDAEIEILGSIYTADGIIADEEKVAEAEVALKVIRERQEEIRKLKEEFKAGFHAETGAWWMDC